MIRLLPSIQPSSCSPDPTGNRPFFQQPRRTDREQRDPLAGLCIIMRSDKQGRANGSEHVYGCYLNYLAEGCCVEKGVSLIWNCGLNV